MFHSKGLLDFLMIGDINSAEDMHAVHKHLVSIGATESKLIVKLRVCSDPYEHVQQHLVACRSDGSSVTRLCTGHNLRQALY
jgi:hypothetical protein